MKLTPGQIFEAGVLVEAFLALEFSKIDVKNINKSDIFEYVSSCVTFYFKYGNQRTSQPLAIVDQ